jgi:hypothetical protein
MTAPIMSFEQRNLTAKTELRLFSEYLEFNCFGDGIKDGFNVKYESLPADFDFQTFRPRNAYILHSVTFVAAVLPIVLLRYRGNALPVIGIALLVGIILAFVGSAIHWLYANDYTTLRTHNGDILIVEDAQHDRIISELRARRLAALKKTAVVNRLQNPWYEVKRFKFLRDEGIISENDFNLYKESIFAPGGPEVGSGNSTTLH